MWPQASLSTSLNHFFYLKNRTSFLWIKWVFWFLVQIFTGQFSYEVSHMLDIVLGSSDIVTNKTKSLLSWSLFLCWIVDEIQIKINYTYIRKYRELHFFNTILKGCFPWTVITKYWLYSLCCTIHPWAYLTPNSLYLPLLPPAPLLPPPTPATGNH